MSERITKLILNRIDLVDRGDNPGATVTITKRQLTSAARNKLPDSAFAYVDENGVGHLPYKNADGTVDLPHLRNALARLNQTQIPADKKAAVQAKLDAAARKAGVGSHTEKRMPEDLKDEEQIVKAAAAGADDGDEPDEDDMPPAKAKKAMKKVMDAEIAKRDTQIAELAKRAKDSEAEIAKMRFESERSVFIAKAATLDGVFGPAEEIGSILHKVAKVLTAEEMTGLQKRLATAANVVKQANLFTEVGVSVTGEDTPDAMLDRAVQDIRKVKPTLTKEQAYVEALSDPTINAAYTKSYNAWRAAAQPGREA